MKDWALTKEETSKLLDSLKEPGTLIEIPDQEDWKYFVFVMPANFHSILLETIEGYKLLTESEKTFPAIEAIFMEARNALPQEIIDRVQPKEG